MYSAAYGGRAIVEHSRCIERTDNAFVSFSYYCLAASSPEEVWDIAHPV